MWAPDKKGMLAKVTTEITRLGTTSLAGALLSEDPTNVSLTIKSGTRSTLDSVLPICCIMVCEKYHIHSDRGVY